MNTTITTILLIALSINIVCDIVRLWTFFRTVEESKENVKDTMSKVMNRVYVDWMNGDDGIINGTTFGEYFKNNFDKYL